MRISLPKNRGQHSNGNECSGDSSKRCAFQLGPLAGARGPGEHALLGKPAYGVFLRLLLFLPGIP